MKLSVIIPTICSVCLIIFSCGQNKVVDEKIEKETPKVLKDEGYDFGSIRKGQGNLVNDLYYSISDTSLSLKELNNEMNEIYKKQSELKNNFNSYNQKNTQYYYNAKSMALEIQDSLLREKIMGLIKMNENKYLEHSKEISHLIKKQANKDTSITDYYNAFKVILTLPVIERYQKGYLPEKKPYKDLLDRQKKVVKTLDSLILSF